METANNILGFNFSPVVLQQAANNIVPKRLTLLSELRIDKLNTIIEEVGGASFKSPPETLIPQVFKKFKLIFKKGGLTLQTFEKNELRTLSYALSYSEQNLPQIFNNEKELDFVFQILEANWKDSYLIGLLDCYLRSWESTHISSSEKLGKYLFAKLGQYKGGRTVLKSFKNNIKYFDRRNGDVILGSELVIENKPIKEATKYLSLPDSWFIYAYFSKVIVAYYEKRKSSIGVFIDELNNALLEHKNSVTNRRIVSKLIIQANTIEFAFLQDRVKSIAFKLVGDSGNVSNWLAFENATDNEKQDLKKARSLLNEWITRQFINVFFEKCIHDPRRKRFWLKYAKEITQFKVVGSYFIKRTLMNDPRISEYVSTRFANTNSAKDSNAALMFVMKNHLFIEFSDNGAFYAYKLSNPNAPSMEAIHFYSTSDLKTPSMSMIAYRTGVYIDRVYDEGRLGHSDGELSWEEVASFWIKEKAEINV